MDRRILALLFATLLLGSGCSKQMLPTDPVANQTALTELQQTETQSRHSCRGAATITGTASDGSLFALYRPEHWNGDLVVYAHGYIPPFSPLALPTLDYTEAIRDALLDEGYGVAYSSYAANGFAVEEGARDTGELSERFALGLGCPRHTYLVAHSLGGLIAVALAERYPRRYDGVLTFSGMLGGSRRELAYVSNVRVLFDHFYPNVLPGDLLHLPANLDLDHDIIGPAGAAILADPSGAIAMSQIKQTPIPFADASELVQSIVQALILQAIELGDLLQRTGGGSFFDNRHTVYTSNTLPAALLQDLNARVGRFDMPASAREYLARNYEPTGRLEMPMLALHTTRDPVVPIFNESVYAEKVRDAHRSRLLIQRTENRYGHVGFPPDVILAAFHDLVETNGGGNRHRQDDRVAGRR